VKGLSIAHWLGADKFNIENGLEVRAPFLDKVSLPNPWK